MTHKENPQRAHYIDIHNAYERHYFDDYSMRYRESFFYKPLLQGLNLEGKKIADIACSSGFNSHFLKIHIEDVSLTGFDISPLACEAYNKNVGGRAFEIDLTKPLKQDFGKFDFVMVIGGLHHCIGDLETTIDNISDMLNPGGMLLMIEPNKAFYLQKLRDYWYRHDKYFDSENEEALLHEELIHRARGKFQVDSVKYMGGPGYFLVLNSLLFRLPKFFKHLLTPSLMLVDRIYNGLHLGRWAFPYFVARWVKKVT